MFLKAGKEVFSVERICKGTQACTKCYSFDFKVILYRECFHLYFFPTIPLKTRFSRIYCNHCGQPAFSKQLEEELLSTLRVPLFFYSGSFVILSLIAILFFLVFWDGKLDKAYYSDPKKGDVYQVRRTDNGVDTYFFYKLIEVKGDTFVIYPNSRTYHKLVSKPDKEDYYDIKQKTFWLGYQRKIMFEQGLIIGISRND